MRDSLRDISTSGDWNLVIWSWLEAASMYCVKSIWKVDVVYSDLPALRALFAFSRMLWWLLSVASSGMMSAFVLFASRRTVFARDDREHYAGDSSSLVLASHSSRSSLSRSQAIASSSGADHAMSSVSEYSSSAATDILLPPAAVNSRHRRPRISRIPDRLCKTLGT
ncbi:hypothetical protein BC628DRAFT_197728 [Trametes gibbosa]|nr:hypothetical protein BC628DRAFT_197728 [Trametes gibbosa]